MVIDNCPNQVTNYKKAHSEYIAGKIRGRSGGITRQLLANLREAEAQLTGLCVPDEMRTVWNIRLIEALTKVASNEGDQKQSHYEGQLYERLLHLTRGE